MDDQYVTAMRVIALTLAVLNVGMALARRRPRGWILFEVGVYAVWSSCVFLLNAPALPFLIILTMLMVGKTELSRFLLRNGADLEIRLRRAVYGERFTKRIEVAQARMADRERRAREQGVSILDILKQDKMRKDGRS